MVTVKAIRSVLWEGKYYTPKDGEFDIKRDAADIYQNNGSLEILNDTSEELPSELAEFNDDELAMVDESFRLSDLDAVDEELEKEIQAIGIFNLEDLKSATVDDLTVINGVGKKTARKILGEVK